MMYNYITTLIEIIFFVCIAFAIITLLAKDKRCNMVGYFVLYLFALIITHECALLSIHYFLYWMSPCFAFLFMLFQQEQLQKNFVTITHTSHDIALQPTADFITILLQIGLHNSLNNKKSFFIIEGNQDLSLLIDTHVPLQIPLQKKVIECICDSALYNQDLAIWIQYTGIIKGINSQLIQNNTMQYDRLLNKTDCFIIYCNEKSAWTFKHRNIMYEQLNTAQIQKLCKQKMESLVQQRSFLHVPRNTQNSQTTNP
ncbi:hypothetical protein EKK58_06800 [Candidatus Dependentiae bacterium]|nr:MAG: hypothetical protein EKK58_06800 [Candidatus Dependentiae bacterium]